MGRLSSAAYVTALLRFLQAFNADDLDGCERLLDKDVEWHNAAPYTGRDSVRSMLESLKAHYTRAQARPDDFREAAGHVLMVVTFYEGDTEAPAREERQAWVAAMTEEGLVRRVIAYPSPADAARALEALAAAALKVHA
jgi:hypothetical protein